MERIQEIATRIKRLRNPTLLELTREEVFEAYEGSLNFAILQLRIALEFFRRAIISEVNSLTT